MLPGIEMGVQSGGNPGGGGGGGGGGFGSFSINFNPQSVSRTQASAIAATLTSPAVTAYPSGGTPPYSFAWSFKEGFVAVEADSPDSATSTFSAFLEPGTIEEAVMRVTVTDAAMASAYADVPVTFNLIQRDYKGEL